MVIHKYEDLIVLQNADLLSKNVDLKKSVIHQVFQEKNELPLAITAKHLYFPIQEMRLKHEAQSYMASIKGFNAPGMHHLSSLLNQAIKIELASSPLALADEFQLEANLKQFDIEVNSLFLVKRLQELEPVSPVKLEELNRLLAIQLVILNQIQQNLQKILALHPRFLPLYEKITAFQQLLTAHLLTQNYGLIPLLIFEKIMKLTPILIGNIQGEKNRIFIALWLALKHLKSAGNSSIHKLFNTCYHQAFHQDPPPLPINLF